MVYNEAALSKFGTTGVGSIYRLCRSLYSWQIRERTGGNEDTIFAGTLEECEKKVEGYINAGYGVIVNK